MGKFLKPAVLATTASLALCAGQASAAIDTHSFRSNAVNYCQAFTPGITNTIRNRVVGAENVGSEPVAVACNFHSMSNGDDGNEAPKSVSLAFSNNNPVGTPAIEVTCTLLTGSQGQAGAYAVSKTATNIVAGSLLDRVVLFTENDNPAPDATTLGSSLIGVNCILPPGAVINQTQLSWDMDNGV